MLKRSSLFLGHHLKTSSQQLHTHPLSNDSTDYLNMAKQQYVNVEFRLPVEVYSRLKEVYDDQTKAKLTDLGTAQHEMFEALEDMTGYTHVTIATFERRVKLWVGDDLQMFEVWEELEKIHGIKRAGRKFSFCGEEMDDCRVPGEVSGLSFLCSGFNRC